jgi:cell pole-organizing protein PopZ
MGYAVLHLDKSPGNESAMTDHIERKIIHPNVYPNRIHLNKELIEFPEGVNNRTEAIRHRLETAGLKRQIGKNQVQVIRFMLSGTPEDMKRIQDDGRLDEWCRDNIDWLKKTYGKENVVAATLHMDETTPHIHASVVPIVRGERRQKDSKKKKQEQEQTDKPKRKYKKKDPNRVRLCCDDVMAKAKLIEYQDSYGEAMNKYGLIRGIKGSDARHITLTEFYRNQAVECKNLQENIGLLLAVEDAKRLSIEELKRQEQEVEKLKQQKETELKESIGYLEEEKQEVYEKVRAMYDRKDEAREKFLHMHEYTQQKEQEIAITEARLEQLKQNYEPYKAREDLNLLSEIFPQLSERLRIAQLCKSIGLTIDATKRLFNGESLSVTGKLHSPEHNQSFEAKDAKLQLFKDRDSPNKLKLSINGKNILDWLRQKFQELRQSAKITQKPENSKGIRR